MNTVDHAYAGELAERVERAMDARGLAPDASFDMSAVDWLLTSSASEVHSFLVEHGMADDVFVHLPRDPSAVETPEGCPPNLHLARVRVAAIRSALDGVCTE